MPPLRWGGSGWWLARACSNCLSCSAFVRCCLARSAMLPSCASVSTTPPLVVPASADEVPSMLVAASCASAMLLARQRGEVERSGERRAEGDNTQLTTTCRRSSETVRYMSLPRWAVTLTDRQKVSPRGRSPAIRKWEFLPP